jgi:hypothetical protein
MSKSHMTEKSPCKSNIKSENKERKLTYADAVRGNDNKKENNIVCKKNEIFQSHSF